jgi:uncharacterized protein YerC
MVSEKYSVIHTHSTVVVVTICRIQKHPTHYYKDKIYVILPVLYGYET